MSCNARWPSCPRARVTVDGHGREVARAHHNHHLGRRELAHGAQVEPQLAQELRAIRSADGQRREAAQSVRFAPFRKLRIGEVGGDVAHDAGLVCAQEALDVAGRRRRAHRVDVGAGQVRRGHAVEGVLDGVEEPNAAHAVGDELLQRLDQHRE